MFIARRKFLYQHDKRLACEMKLFKTIVVRLRSSHSTPRILQSCLTEEFVPNCAKSGHAEFIPSLVNP